MSRGKKHPYNIYYRDNTFMTFHMSKSDYGKLEKALTEQKSHVALSIGTLALHDIRSVIEQRVPEKERVNKKQKPALPIMDDASMEWFKENMNQIWGEDVN